MGAVVMMGAIELAAKTMAPAVSASARPALTFAVVDVAAAIAVRHGHASLPPSSAWLVSTTMIVVAVVFAIVEAIAHHDTDIAAILRDVHADKMLTVFGALSSAALLTALGAPTEAPIRPEPVNAEVIEAVRLTAASHASPTLRVAAIGVSVVGSLGLSWVRSKLLSALDRLHLSSVWAKLETGGTLALMLAVVLAPMLAVLLMTGSVVAMCAISASVHIMSRARDALARRPCPSCNLRIRREASLCHGCRTEIEPQTLLEPAR
jgi:hypothetical protein